MPAEENKNTLARQWEMLKMLPSRRPGITARELSERLQSEGFNVSKRTVERDLQSLSATFPLSCNDQSTPFGWYFAPGCHLDLPGLTLSEALTLKLVEQYLTPLLPGTMMATLGAHFEQAARKLDDMADSNPAARWTEKIRSVLPSQPLLSPTVDADILKGLQEALLRERQVEVHYRKPGARENAVYALNPLALLQRGPVTYLVATAFTYSDVRLYALHRMHALTGLDSAALRPDGFDLDAYIRQGGANFGGGTEIELRLRVDAKLAAFLAEAPLAENMRLRPDGDRHLVEATLPDTWQLRWWILSQAEQAEVLEPPSLREEIRLRLASALGNYAPLPTATA